MARLGAAGVVGALAAALVASAAAHEINLHKRRSVTARSRIHPSAAGSGPAGSIRMPAARAASGRGSTCATTPTI
ncbi:MAG: hypothetical protein P8Z80_16980 [Pseudolabrys sp.]